MSPRPTKVKPNPISIDAAVQFAWQVFKKRNRLFVAILLTILSAWVALEILVIGGQDLGIFWWGVWHFAFLLFLATVSAGLLKICLAFYDDQAPTFSDTFANWTLGPKFLICQMLYLLLVLVGLLMLIVPGIYLGARYALFGFCLLANNPRVLPAFQQSATLSAGGLTKLTMLWLALGVLNALGASLLGFGLFFTIPFSLLIMTAVYKQLREQRHNVV